VSDDVSHITERLQAIDREPITCSVQVIEGPDRGKSLALSSEWATIGCSSPCALKLTDTAVSGEHLTARLDNKGGVELRDLGSTNGTRYLGTLVREVVVPVGAVVQLGRTQLAFRASAIASAAPVTGYGSIVGSSARMQRLYAQLRTLEAHDHTILVTGETGVGKERVAQEIHAHSRRAAIPLVVFDCGAVSPTLMESELFGHVRGAFTGADRDRVGAFVRANGGTLLLDEIGELPLELQPKLLRALEERIVRPLGSNEESRVDVRIISSTNRDLESEVRHNRFRRDLYYRLNVLHVHVPALRERTEDVPLLAAHFLAQVAEPGVDLSSETLALLTSGYTWPGNVRELRNTVVRAVSLGNTDLPHFTEQGPAVKADDGFIEARKRVLEAFERDFLSHHLHNHEGNISQAARSAGLDRAYFRRLCVKYGLVT
jgi:two-component system nitrogen regulation response regulator GlnG